ncbi:MAG TPA: hypothetical protein PKZ61_18375, partial [Thermoflexales bacterium]|nr:hypothetical protein [Thermoflexales bacterium]
KRLQCVATRNCNRGIVEVGREPGPKEQRAEKAEEILFVACADLVTAIVEAADQLQPVPFIVDVQVLIEIVSDRQVADGADVVRRSIAVERRQVVFEMIIPRARIERQLVAQVILDR